MGARSKKDRFEIKAGIRRDLARLRKILAESGIEGYRLILFGSHARGEARPQSDLDLCFVFPDKTAGIDALRPRIQGISGMNGLNVDVVTTTVTELRKNLVSPILHEIRKYGLPVD